MGFCGVTRFRKACFEQIFGIGDVYIPELGRVLCNKAGGAQPGQDVEQKERDQSQGANNRRELAPRYIFERR